MKSYIPRSLSKYIIEAAQHFKVIMLTGPRQVGKTTLLEHAHQNPENYISFDDISMRVQATNDPAGFVGRLKLPVLLDEVQYVPDLFSYIKIAVDKLKQPGMFWLTGSQQFELMKHGSESLAGRAAIFKLQGISLAEELNYVDRKAFLPNLEIIASQKYTLLNINEIYYKIWRGSFPDLLANSSSVFWERFYESYISTYLQRDVSDYLKIKDRIIFYKFLQILAARTGQLLNYADLARDISISEPTVKSWIDILQLSGLVYLLRPYNNNKTKSLVKTAKLYFMDTGLCAFLAGWFDPVTLERGAMSGAILETYVISEIIKSYLHNGRTPRISFYRDKAMNEIDLLIEENGLIYPCEIKKTASLHNINLKSFYVLQNTIPNLANGTCLCFTERITHLNDFITAWPISYI